MCLAVPGRVESLAVDNGVRMARVDFGGIRREVCVEHVPDAVVGEFVLVHVGFAIAKVDEDEARRIMSLLEQLEVAKEGANA